jgi:HEAT repeats
MSREVHCPHCGWAQVVTASNVVEAFCPACKETFVLPALGVPVSEAIAPREESYAPPAVQSAGPTHCVGCGKRLHNTISCPACGDVYCSEMCVTRHMKLTGHRSQSPARRETARSGCGSGLAVAAALCLGACCVMGIAGSFVARQAPQPGAALPQQKAPPVATIPGGQGQAILKSTAKEILAAYGQAEKDDNTDLDVPRPFIVTRIIDYQPERVRFIFVPAGRGDARPTVDWVLSIQADAVTGDPLTPDEVESRLKSRRNRPAEKLVVQPKNDLKPPPEKTKEEMEAEAARLAKEAEQKILDREISKNRVLADLKSKDLARRSVALAEIGVLDERLKEAAADLVALLNDNLNRDTAALALTAIGKDAVPDLLKGLKSENFFVRQRCALVLGQIGPEARAAIPILRSLVAADPSATVRNESEAALRKLVPKK